MKKFNIIGVALAISAGLGCNATPEVVNRSDDGVVLESTVGVSNSYQPASLCGLLEMTDLVVEGHVERMISYQETVDGQQQAYVAVTFNASDILYGEAPDTIRIHMTGGITATGQNQTADASLDTGDPVILFLREHYRVEGTYALTDQRVFRQREDGGWASEALLNLGKHDSADLKRRINATPCDDVQPDSEHIEPSPRAPDEAPHHTEGEVRPEDG